MNTYIYYLKIGGAWYEWFSCSTDVARAQWASCDMSHEEAVKYSGTSQWNGQ